MSKKTKIASASTSSQTLAVPGMIPTRSPEVAFDYGQLEPELAARARGAAQQIRTLHDGMAMNGYEIGEHLNGMKEVLPHGHFESWTMSEFPSISKRLLEKCMNVADAFRGRSEIISLLGPTMAYALAAPGVQPEVREDIVRRCQAGEKITVAKAQSEIRAHMTSGEATGPAATAKRTKRIIFTPEGRLQAIQVVDRLLSYLTAEQEVDVGKLFETLDCTAEDLGQALFDKFRAAAETSTPNAVNETAGDLGDRSGPAGGSAIESFPSGPTANQDTTLEQPAATLAENKTPLVGDRAPPAASFLRDLFGHGPTDGNTDIGRPHYLNSYGKSNRAGLWWDLNDPVEVVSVPNKPCKLLVQKVEPADSSPAEFRIILATVDRHLPLKDDRGVAIGRQRFTRQSDALSAAEALIPVIQAATDDVFRDLVAAQT